MSKTEKILTLHPDGKKGVNIDLYKYTTIKNFILETLNRKGEMTYQELNTIAVAKLSSSFDGKVNWYLITVKLDLEARNIIERIPKTSPHQIRLT